MADGPKKFVRARRVWRLRGRVLAMGERTLVMGVLNVTPDSFSDGGKFLAVDAAVAHGLQMLEEGADILDVGGESTRPGAEAVSAEEELRRVVPVIAALRAARPDALVSVDTSKSEVARAAVAAGAEIVNDVSGLTWDVSGDGGMAAACAEMECGVVAMHSRGVPTNWRELPGLSCEEVVPLVRAGLEANLSRALAAGIHAEAVALDPGFGFGKRGEENFWLLAGMAEFAELGRPLVAGVSRKSFLGAAGDPEARLHATIAATVATVLAGAHVVRVHDVRAAVDAVGVADAILRVG
jgi:dihydropteroate synthase